PARSLARTRRAVAGRLDRRHERRPAIARPARLPRDRRDPPLAGVPPHLLRREHRGGDRAPPGPPAGLGAGVDRGWRAVRGRLGTLAGPRPGTPIPSAAAFPLHVGRAPANLPFP